MRIKTTLFGKELRKIRIDRDWTLNQLSEKIGVSASYISAVERGHKKSYSLVMKLNDAKLINEDEIKTLTIASWQTDGIINIKIDKSYKNNAEIFNNLYKIIK